MQYMTPEDNGEWKNYVNELFTYHPPISPSQIKLYEDMRAEYKKLAHFIIENVPAGTQREMAIQYLHIASMQTNAGIALNSESYKDEE